MADHSGSAPPAPRDSWERVERPLSILAQEISSVRERQITVANRISEKISATGSPLLQDAQFLRALQDFDLMSQELEHTAALLAAISESLSDHASADEAIDRGIDKVKLSSMRSRLRAVVDGVSPTEAAKDDDSELW